MTQKTCTVIITNRNNSDYLHKCIVSCLEQTYPVKIAVIDDASTDDSKTILKRMCNNFGVSVLYNGTQLGPSESRNKLIQKHIDSDCFAILDADDYFETNKIAEMIKYLDIPRVGVVYGDYYHLYNDGRAVPEFKKRYSRELLFRESIIHSGSLISKEAMLSAKLSDGEYYDNSMRCCEDWDLFLRITKRYSAIHVPKFLTWVRITGQNSSDYLRREEWEKNWSLISQRMQSGYYF